MNLNLASLVADKTAENVKQFRMICWTPDPFPESSMIEFAAVLILEDVIKSHDDQTCLVFSDDTLPILKAWTENQDVFPFVPVLLAGVPNTAPTYEGAFESYTYDLGQVSYHNVVGDMAEEMRRAESMTESERQASQYKSEQASITRKSGHVKDFVMFDSPTKSITGPVASAGKPMETEDDEDETASDTVE